MNRIPTASLLTLVAFQLIIACGDDPPPSDDSESSPSTPRMSDVEDMSEEPALAGIEPLPATGTGGSQSVMQPAMGGAPSGGADRGPDLLPCFDAHQQALELEPLEKFGAGGAGGNGASACSEERYGTHVADGTCAALLDFETDKYLGGVSQSDGRVYSGVDVDPSTCEPRLAPGKDGTGTGSLVITSDAASGSGALRFSYAGAAEWGGGFSVTFTHSACYDASAYEGVRLTAKRKNPGPVFVGFATADTHPFYDCDEALGRCYVGARTSIWVNQEYETFEVRWADVAIPPWGVEEEFDPRRLVGLLIHDAGDRPLNDIELFVDDIEFIGGNNTECH